METTTLAWRLMESRARSMRLRWPWWSAPMVGTKAMGNCRACQDLAWRCMAETVCTTIIANTLKKKTRQAKQISRRRNLQLAQGGLGLGVIRVEAQGLAEMGRRLVPFALARIGQGQ